MSDFTLSRISKSDNWATPDNFYQELNKEFHFNDDPCPLTGTGGLDREWEIDVNKAVYYKVKGVIVPRRMKKNQGFIWKCIHKKCDCPYQKENLCTKKRNCFWKFKHELIS
jgi:hypothetical protein